MIHNYELDYIDERERKDQDSRMLYSCPIKSISVEVKNKITIWKDDYHIRIKSYDTA